MGKERLSHQRRSDRNGKSFALGVGQGCEEGRLDSFATEGSYGLAPGRQSWPAIKGGLDETEKATREFKSICTRMVKDKFGGSFILARDAARAAYGKKSEYKRSELDRLSSSPANEAEDAELG